MELNEGDVTSIADFVFDENDDGIIDNIVEYKTDAFGRIIEICLDYDGDNVTDSKVFFEYGIDGKINKVYKDKNHDGIIDSIATYEYDSSGNKTVYYDDNADGKVDYIEKIDENGLTVIKDVRDFKQKIKETLKDIFSK